MKKVYIIAMTLMLSAILSGCFYPVPVNQGGTKFVAGHGGGVFSIAGNNLSNFEWYLDGDLIEGYGFGFYAYAPQIEDIGNHKLLVTFNQDGDPKYWEWKIIVSAPTLSGEDEGEAALE